MTPLWCIAENADAALKLAARALAGLAKCPYLFECDCLAAWRAQPSFMGQLYRPYRIDVQGGVMTVQGLASSRHGG